MPVRSGRPIGSRRGRGRAALLGLAVCIAAALAATPAVAAPRDLEARVALEGSNGFRVVVTGGAYSGFRTASMRARRAGRLTVYATVRDVTLTRRRFAADFGDQGSVRLRFEPGNARLVDGDPRCGRGRARIVSGGFSGRIDLRGEHGFTRVEGSAGPGKLIHSGVAWCRKRKSEPHPRNPDRRSSLSSCRADGPRTSTGLIVYYDRPLGPRSVGYRAIRLERSEGIYVSRYVDRRAAAATMRVERGDFSSARISPPGPFAGSAAYEAGNGPGELTGDLTIGFAGSGGRVPITPADDADFGPRRTGLLDCVYGIAPARGGAPAASLARALAAPAGRSR